MATRTPDNHLNFDRLSSNNKLSAKTPITQRRYTPYTKSNLRTQVLNRTPLPSIHQKRRSVTQKRQQRFDEVNNEKIGDISSSIANRSWRVYRVTPLFRFKTDAQSLKLYERCLNRFLAAETCVTTESTPTTAKRKPSLRKLEGDTDGDYGVEMRITRSEGKENASKEELLAVLCCGGGLNNEGGKTKYPDMVSLPVCLVKSPALLQDLVLQWLENRFGCRACPLLFSPTDLAWMVTLFAGIGEPTSSVELTYKVPAVIEGLDTINFKMDAKDMRRIWNKLHDQKQPYFTNDEAVMILKSMETHFYNHFKIHLNQMQLTTVGTSVAYIGSEGRVKILQESYVCYVLQQLSQLASF